AVVRTTSKPSGQCTLASSEGAIHNLNQMSVNSIRNSANNARWICCAKPGKGLARNGMLWSAVRFDRGESLIASNILFMLISLFGPHPRDICAIHSVDKRQQLT